jgi:predicted porin
LNKKVLTAATLAVFATAAHAQSSVTLYGLIDAGISYVNNSKTSSSTTTAFRKAAVGACAARKIWVAA